MLRLARCLVEVRLGTLMMMDSLDMTGDDRRAVVESCRACPEDRVVVTHGTDTMAETARALVAAGLDKTIVLTGAMIPYAFGSSDGLFNLGSALSFAQVLPAGVYVAMNGRCFAGDRVRKNRDTGLFEEGGPGSSA
jgi:L-asparaginase